MIHPCLDCAAVPGCGYGNWDLFFAIASPASVAAGICVPAKAPLSFPPGYPQFANVGANDAVSNLQGVWSTDASAVTTMSSTGYDGAAWSSIGNALQEDGTYASIQPASFPSNRLSDCNIGGSGYLVLTGFGANGLNVPIGSVLYGISVGLKGYHYTREISNVSGITKYTYNFFPNIYNAGLVLNGVLYPFADPSQDWLCNPGVAHGQPPWPSDPQGLYSQGFDWTKQRTWPVVIDPSWYGTDPGPSSPTLPTVPSAAQLGVIPLVSSWFLRTNSPISDSGPRWTGNQTACPDTFTVPFGAHIGPMEKTFNLTPTKQTWTAAEVNDPTFGIAVSILSMAITNPPPGGTTRQTFVFLDCAGVAIYFTPPASGGGTVGQRSRLWIST